MSILCCLDVSQILFKAILSTASIRSIRCLGQRMGQARFRAKFFSAMRMTKSRSS